MNRISAIVKTNLLWLIIILLAGLLTRIPHIISFISYSSETALTYFPTLGAARFEQCARALVDGTQSGDAFAFASPMYILILAILYALGITNTVVFVLQTVMGIATPFLIFLIGLKTGASKNLSCTGAVAWLFYAPSAFYELTLLPITLLAFLISVWALYQLKQMKTKTTSLLHGFMSGIITGLRPPFILLGVVSFWKTIRSKNYLHSIFMLIGFSIPLLILCFYHSSQGGSFSPFASSLGLNLVQGHADGATGYGPPIPEYDLIENPSENIHEVGARVAAEHGYETSSDANKFWLKKAVNWILNNPAGEMRLLGAKLGAFLGFTPFDSYFDLQRDIKNDASLFHLILPRFLLVAFLIGGIVPFLIFRNKNWVVVTPFLISLVTILAFFHSERYLLPVLPVTFGVASYGLHLLFHKLRTVERKKAIAAILISISLLLPGILWPTPEISEGQYLYNRAAKAYNMRNYLLALTLFEESAEISPPGTTTSIHSRMEALRISQAYNFEDRIILHTESLQAELQ